jgi:hypothetical protein
MAERVIDVITPLKYRVVLSRNRWREIVRFKHPAVARYQDKIRTCLEDPDIVRASAFLTKRLKQGDDLWTK